MNNQTSPDLAYRWIILGAICGPLAVITFAVLIFVSLPDFPGMVLVGVLGPLLGLASVGLYHFIALVRKTVSLQIAVVANIIAVACLSMMLIVQTSLNMRMERAIARLSDPAAIDNLKAIWRAVDSVQLGIDIAWDVYICLGTLLFAINMLQHPRLGKIIGIIGIILALGLFVFNIYTFPTPPGDANLIDLGPFVALWYLAVSIMILFSLRWAREILGEQV